MVYTTDGVGVGCGACANPEAVTQKRTRTTLRIEKVFGGGNRFYEHQRESQLVSRGGSRTVRFLRCRRRRACHCRNDLAPICSYSVLRAHLPTLCVLQRPP